MIDNEHLLLTNIQLVPGFIVTCNISNVHAYLLTTASVSVLRKYKSFNAKQTTYYNMFLLFVYVLMIF